MHIYVSHLKDAELKTLIATYDIPLDLRPRLPDSNFRMINLPAGDTAIGIYSRIFDSSGVRIPFSSFLLAVLKYFKVHISQLVPLGLSKVITFEVLCRSLSIEPTVTLFRVFQTLSKQGDWFSFAKRGGSAPVCMEVTKSGLNPMEGKKFLNRSVVDRTTPPAPAGTAIPHASPEEIAVTRPDPNVVAKADHAAKRKTSTGPEISTNTTKRTRLSQRVSGAGSSGLAAGDGVEQTDDGTLDDDGQRDGSESAMEDVENLNDVGQGEHINVIPLRTFDPSLGLDVTYPPILLPDKEVGAHAELSGGVRRTTRASSYASHGVGEDVSSPAQEAMAAPGTQPLDTNAGADEIASDGNVDSYFDAEVQLCDDVLRGSSFFWSRGLITFLSSVENDGSEIHRLHELSSVELSDRMSVLQCQLLLLGAHFCLQHKESTVHASDEVSGLKAELGALKSKCEATEHKLSSWDKKHRKYRSERDILAKEKTKIKEELKSYSEFNRAFAGVLNTAISVGVERGLRMGRTDEEFRGLSQRVAGFIPDAKEKFDRVIAAFPDATFPFLDKVSQHSQSSLQDIARLEPDRVTPSSQPSSATASLRTSTHARHSTSSSGTFGHTSTPEHLKKKKKPVERGGPSAA
ncbi:hypothetical protein Tco_0196100 [Tanacetum coccineum]